MDGRSSGIPVVDLGIHGSSSASNGVGQQQKIANKLCDALKEIGFVYLINHGIPQDQIDSAFEISKEYFKLPEPVKRADKFTVKTLTGYTGIGDEVFETGPTDCKEAYDVALNKHRYPADPEDFQPIIRPLIDEYVDLSKHVLQLIAQGMGFPKNTFSDHHKNVSKGGNLSIFRTLYYPPMTKANEGATRCGAHTDYGTLTLLIQDDAGGLQVRNRRNEWVDAVPIPGAVLVNLGDLFEIWTGGELKATEHQVTAPTDPALRARSRSSMVMFLTADDEVLVEPMTGNKSYKAVNAGEHMVKRLEDSYV